MNDELGTMCVDWEQRIDFDRLRHERVQKAQAAIAESEADLLFVFRTEDARCLTAYRHHLGPTPVIGTATVVVGADLPPILFTMDETRRPHIYYGPFPVDEELLFPGGGVGHGNGETAPAHPKGIGAGEIDP